MFRCRDGGVAVTRRREDRVLQADLRSGLERQRAGDTAHGPRTSTCHHIQTIWGSTELSRWNFTNFNGGVEPSHEFQIP